jgi:hypothetical protein
MFVAILTTLLALVPAPLLAAWHAHWAPYLVYHTPRQLFLAGLMAFTVTAINGLQVYLIFYPQAFKASAPGPLSVSLGRFCAVFFSLEYHAFAGIATALAVHLALQTDGGRRVLVAVLRRLPFFPLRSGCANLRNWDEWLLDPVVNGGDLMCRHYVLVLSQAELVRWKARPGNRAAMLQLELAPPDVPFFWRTRNLRGGAPLLGGPRLVVQDVWAQAGLSSGLVVVLDAVGEPGGGADIITWSTANGRTPQDLVDLLRMNGITYGRVLEMDPLPAFSSLTGVGLFSRFHASGWWTYDVAQAHPERKQLQLSPPYDASASGPFWLGFFNPWVMLSGLGLWHALHILLFFHWRNPAKKVWFAFCAFCGHQPWAQATVFQHIACLYPTLVVLFHKAALPHPNRGGIVRVSPELTYSMPFYNEFPLGSFKYSVITLPLLVSCFAFAFVVLDLSVRCVAQQTWPSPCKAGAAPSVPWFSAPVFSATTCTLCSAGTSSVAGASECTHCAAGTYQPAVGQSECTQCAAGFYLSAVGSVTPCSPCAAGTFSAAGASTCMP